MENYTQQEKAFILGVEKAIDVTAKILPDDVLARLSEMRDNETSPSAKAFYDCYFENLEKA